MSSKPLHRRWDFRWAFLGPFLIAVAIAESIYCAEPSYAFCFTSECYGFVLKIFQIPLTVLAASLPLAGIVAAYHRSIETQTQIELTIRNNTFSNYIKHKEEFSGIFTSFDSEKLGFARFDHGNIQVIYDKIFPANSYSNLVLVPDDFGATKYFNKLEAIISDCIVLLEDKNPSEEAIFSFFKDISSGLDKLQINISAKSHILIKFKTESVYLPDCQNPTFDLFAVILMLSQRLHYFCGIKSKHHDLSAVDENELECVDIFISKYFSYVRVDKKQRS